MEATPGGAAAVTQLGGIQVLVLVQLAWPAVAPILNAIPTFGEEYGWRGYLLPALLPLGQWRALILDGVIWGLWHAPVIALGYNYPLHPILGIALMCVFTTLFGIILGWTRLATGSIWPAVIGHGALNGSAGLAVLLAQANTTVDTALATILGVAGWVVMLLVIALLVLARQLPVRRPATEPIIGGPAPAVLGAAARLRRAGRQAGRSRSRITCFWPGRKRSKPNWACSRPSISGAVRVIGRRSRRFPAGA